MIEINLLPKELRKKKKKAKEVSVSAISLPVFEAQILPICAGVIGLFISLNIILSLLTGINNFRAARMGSTWTKLQPQKEIMDQMKKERGELEIKLGLANKVSNPYVQWTQLLSGLNQSVIPGIWLQSFKPVFPAAGRKGSTESAKFPTMIKLNGYALGASEVATATVARFINSLKSNEDFSIFFDDIEMQDIRSKVMDGKEAMQFDILCKFKTRGKVPAAGKR